MIKTSLHFSATASLIKLLKLFSFHEEIEIIMEYKEEKSPLHYANEDAPESYIETLLSHPEIDVTTSY